MNEGLLKLTTVLEPPPNYRYHPNVEALRRLCAIIKQALPASYIEFLNCYGPGSIHIQPDELLNFVTVYPPETIIRQNGLFYGALGENIPSAHWPQIPWTRPGGWLIWGYSCDGHQYYWRMAGEPDHWPTVVEDRYSDVREEFRLDLPSFLLAVLTGAIDPRGVPSAVKPGGDKRVWRVCEDQPR
jgi:hypothetical protein